MASSPSRVATSGELLRLWRAVESALKSSDENRDAQGPGASRAKEALEAMARVDGVTSEVLRDTLLGVKMRPLRKHKDVGVRDVATRLIKAWRETVEKEAEPKSKASPLPAPPKDAAKPFEAEGDGGGAAGHGPGETAAAAGVEGGVVCETETKQGHEVVEEQKVHESVCDDDIGSDLDPSRRKIGEVLGNAVLLAATSDDERRRARRLGFEIEAAMAAKFPNPDPNSAVSNGKLYKQKARSLNFNLKDANNPDLRARVLDGDISPAILCELTSEELASDNKRDENVAIRKKMLEENIRGQQQQASTDQFKCGKCKQRKTTFYQLQTRSADEPMTTFVTCVNCGNRWKFC